MLPDTSACSAVRNASRAADPPRRLHLPWVGSRIRAAALALGLAALLGSGPAQATCGSSYCFLDAGSREGLQLPGLFGVDLSFQYIDQTRMREGAHGTDEVLTPKIDFEARQIEPEHHREISTHNRLVRLNLFYGITGRLSVYLHLPLINDRAHEHYDDVGTPDESFTNQDGTSGFGDVQAGARYGLLVKGRDILLGDLAVKLPTGPYELRDSEGAINEPTIQPGTGSTDFLGRLRWSRQIEPRRIETFLSLAYRLNGENGLDYRVGDESVLSAGFSQRLGAHWSWAAQINARHTARDRYLGEPVDSTGVDYVNLTPGLRYAASGGTQLYTFVQLPVYQRVNEAQLTPRVGFVLGLFKTFD